MAINQNTSFMWASGSDHQEIWHFNTFTTMARENAKAIIENLAGGEIKEIGNTNTVMA